MAVSCIDLVAILDLEPIEADRFRGEGTNATMYGGHVIGQAMVAACRTVQGRLPHSLHCCFILPGSPQVPIIYEVERLRDGKRYSTRRVTATQEGRAILFIIVSFHLEEQSTFDHQDWMPQVPSAETLAAEELSKGVILAETPEFIRSSYAIDLRVVEVGRYLGQKIDDGGVHVWIRTTTKLPEDPAFHICALAYLSDYSLLDGVMARYGRAPFDKRVIAASLDHAMWFHRPFRADEWVLYAHDSPSAQRGRGLSRGLIFRSDGTLIATVAQEGSIRERC